MRLSSPIFKLKRQAKRLARERNMRLHEALNQTAAAEGFKDWSHLAASVSKRSPARDILCQMRPGDMVLIAARPGHGKTLLGLEWAALAGTINRSGYVFTLDYNESDVRDRFRMLGFDIDRGDTAAIVDTSDDICAAHIIETVGDAADGALIVVDYLQLLDQKRSTPPLDDQVRALRTFAGETGAIIAMISQIDRAFELSSDGMPAIKDIRLPNPVDLTLFNKRCFLQDGEIQLETVT